MTCKDIDFRLGLTASDGLTAADEGEADWAAWTVKPGCGDAGGFFAGAAAAAAARLPPELCADIVPREGPAGDTDAEATAGARGSGIGPNPGGDGRSSIGIGLPALFNLMASTYC